MDEQTSDYTSQGEYRSSGANVSLAMTLFFVGLAVGAVTALLMAPKTGKQMRRTLRRKYEDAREAVEDLGDQAGDWIDRGSEWADKAKSKVSPLAKQFRR